MRMGLVACCVLAPGCTGDLELSSELSVATIGPDGGAVALADGARLEIPPGALTQPTDIRIALAATDPDDTGVALSRAYRCEPDGLELRKAARIVLPFDMSKLPPDASLPDVLVVTTRPGSGALDALATFQNVSASTASAPSTRLSQFWAAVLPPQACHGEGTSGRQCDDADPCTFGDTCQSECAGLPYDCDDGDPCTVDVCDGLGDCLHGAANDQACGSVDPCTILNGGCGDPARWSCTNHQGVASCSDVDECAADNGGCGDSVYWTCINHVGAAPSCADVDECAVSNGGCDPEHWQCINEEGRDATCVDIDECAIENGGCGAPEHWKCFDNVGVAPSCADINECATSNGDCGSPERWSCVNNRGSAPTCVDIDECATSNGGCGSPTRWTCNNNIGAAPSCVDVDECATLNGGCGDPNRWACRNNLGTAPSCVDIDECATNNGGCGDAQHWKCTNNVGFAPKCTDINDCVTNNGGCGDPAYWTCVNHVGATRTCAPVDHCASDNGGCGSSECWACTNRPGAPPTCTELDACKPTGALVMFFGGYRRANLGGRAGVDALCDSMRPSGVSWAKGFLSVSTSDQIQDVVPPDLRQLPVVTVYGEQLASDWYGLFDGALDRDLNSVVGATRLWSGAGHYGGSVLWTCEGWSSVEGSGSIGCGGVTDERALCCSDSITCSGWGQGLMCSSKASVACVGHAEQAGPVKASWCPPGALLNAVAPVEAGESTWQTFYIAAEGDVRPDSSIWTSAYSLKIGACNASNAHRTLHVEIRGAECIDCPAVFSAVPAGKCVSANFLGTQTSLPELCVYANPAPCSAAQTGYTRCVPYQERWEICDGKEWVAGQYCSSPLPCQQVTPELAQCALW